MNCQHCNSDRIIFIQAHARDCFNINYDKYNIEHDGYCPEGFPLGSGDDIDFIFCAECGMIQDFKNHTDDWVEAYAGS